MATRKVLVTYLIPDKGIAILKDDFDCDINREHRYLPKGEIMERIRKCDAVLPLLTDPIDAEVMDAAPNLRIIANYAVGYNNVDIAAAKERGIMVTNTPDVLTDATADFAWALLFAVSRRIVEADGFTRAGNFTGWEPKLFLGGDITGRTLGIIGAGRIGTAFGQKSAGFGMKVLYCDERRNEVLEKGVGAQQAGLDELLTQADYVSLHVPLLDETRHLIDRAKLELMKPTAYLINTSRGPVVKEADLIDALRGKRIAGAGLDVFEEEPAIPEGMKQLANCVIAPHIASGTLGTRDAMAALAAGSIKEFFAGKTPGNRVV